MRQTPRVRPTTGRRRCRNGADPQCDASQKMPRSQYVLNIKTHRNAPLILKYYLFCKVIQIPFAALLGLYQDHFS